MRPSERRNNQGCTNIIKDLTKEAPRNFCIDELLHSMVGSVREDLRITGKYARTTRDKYLDEAALLGRIAKLDTLDDDLRSIMIHNSGKACRHTGRIGGTCCGAVNASQTKGSRRDSGFGCK